MTLESQYSSILALIPKIERKFNMSRLLNADSSVDSLAVASKILSGAAHRLHEQPRACVVYDWSIVTASGFLKFTSVCLYQHPSTPCQTPLSHSFASSFLFEVACGMEDLISQSSAIITIISFTNALISVKKGSRLNRCMIILLRFLCNRSSCLSALSFCDLITLRFIHPDLTSRLDAILVSRLLTLFGVTHTFLWGFSFPSQVAQLQGAIEFPPPMNPRRQRR